MNYGTVCTTSVVAGTCVTALPATSGNTLATVINLLVLVSASLVVAGAVALNLYKRSAKTK